jgi:hypothetical protein
MVYRQRCIIVIGDESEIGRFCALSPGGRGAVACFCDSEADGVVAAQERIIGIFSIHERPASPSDADNDSARGGLAHLSASLVPDHAPRRLAVTAVALITIDGAFLIAVALGA